MDLFLQKGLSSLRTLLLAHEIFNNSTPHFTSRDSQPTCFKFSPNCQIKSTTVIV